MNYRKSRRARLLAATVTAAGVGLGALAGAPVQSVAAPAVAAADDCADAFPESSLVPGQAVQGRSVVQGTTPEGFTGTYLETLEDGIAPGVDLIMVKLTSPTIDQAGIWQGMSGSPVYDPTTGQLIGAVAYGLSWGPTPVAGLTPAAHLRDLLEGSAGTTRQSGAQRLSPAVRQRLVASGTLTSAEARSTITELGVPLGVSGLSARRLSQLGFLFGGRDVYRAAGAGATADDPIPVDGAGDNLAVSLSTGTLTFGGVGTATLVCGDEVVGFGHPMDFAGKSTYGLHGADAVMVHEDPVGPGFKLANLGARIGVVDQDRLTGVRGLVGPPPTTYDITSTATAPDTTGTTQGTTKVTVGEWFSDIAFSHLLTVQDQALDHIGKGSATATWTVTGLRRDGTPFSYTDSNVYADPFDISFAPVLDIAFQLFDLQENASEKVTLTGLTTETAFGEDATSWNIGRAYWKVGGVWKRISRKFVPSIQAGMTRNVRIELYSRTADTKYVTVPVKVARKASTKRPSWVTIAGGNAGEDLFGFEEWYEDGFGGDVPQSVPEQLAQIKSRQKNNEIRTTVRSPKAGRSSQDKTLGDVVGGTVYFPLRVR